MNNPTEVPVKERAKEFWRRNQSLLWVLPLTLFALWSTYVVLKGLDSKIGAPELGTLYGYLLNAVRVALIVGTAFWIKRRVLFDLHARTELELFHLMKAGDANAHAIVWRDRIEWFVVLAFCTWWYTR